LLDPEDDEPVVEPLLDAVWLLEGPVPVGPPAAPPFPPFPPLPPVTMTGPQAAKATSNGATASREVRMVGGEARRMPQQ
jgi:hypothetical protein